MMVYVVGTKVFSNKDAAEIYAEIAALHDSFSGGHGVGPGIVEAEIDALSVDELETQLDKMTSQWSEGSYKKGYGVSNWKADKEAASEARAEEFRKSVLAQRKLDAEKKAAKAAKAAAKVPYPGKLNSNY